MVKEIKTLKMEIISNVYFDTNILVKLSLTALSEKLVKFIQEIDDNDYLSVSTIKSNDGFIFLDIYRGLQLPKGFNIAQEIMEIISAVYRQCSRNIG